MVSEEVVWRGTREREVALAWGLRVLRNGAAGVQVQLLEPGTGGGVRVVRVVPGDGRHLALWRALMTPESEWGTASWLSIEGENSGD